MTTDFRALCAEFMGVVAAEWGHISELDDGDPFTESSVSDLLTRARAALAAEPQAPTDEDLLVVEVAARAIESSSGF
jgi:hypothetical protein